MHSARTSRCTSHPRFLATSLPPLDKSPCVPQCLTMRFRVTSTVDARSDHRQFESKSRCSVDTNKVAKGIIPSFRVALINLNFLLAFKVTTVCTAEQLPVRFDTQLEWYQCQNENSVLELLWCVIKRDLVYSNCTILEFISFFNSCLLSVLIEVQSFILDNFIAGKYVG